MRPAYKPCKASISPSVRSASSSVRRTWLAKMSPAAVSTMPRGWRSNRGWPTCDSSDAICRLKADAATAVRFEGADAFVSDDPDALKPPEEGETKVYRFTETLADEFLVESRKAVTVANE